MSSTRITSAARMNIGSPECALQPGDAGSRRREQDLLVQKAVILGPDASGARDLTVSSRSRLTCACSN